MLQKESVSDGDHEVLVGLPGMVNVLKKARTNKTSHITLDALSYRYESRYAAMNSVILDTGRLVRRRIASGTGKVGVVANIEGMPNIKVATDNNVIALTKA